MTYLQLKNFLITLLEESYEKGLDSWKGKKDHTLSGFISLGQIHEALQKAGLPLVCSPTQDLSSGFSPREDKSVLTVLEMLERHGEVWSHPLLNGGAVTPEAAKLGREWSIIIGPKQVEAYEKTLLQIKELSENFKGILSRYGLELEGGKGPILTISTETLQELMRRAGML